MEEFFATFEDQSFSPLLMAFLALFVVCFALFHTLLLKTLFNLSVKPKWLLVVLFPISFCVVYYLKASSGMLLFVCFFALLFVLAIVGALFSAISAIARQYKNNPKTGAKNPLYKRVLQVIFTLSAIALFFVSTPLFFLVVIVFIILSKILFPGSTDRFLKFQATLPTSKIRSVAMGLAEIEGRLVMIESLAAPIMDKKCIGYRYVVEERHVDKEGHESFRTIKDETKCSRFYMEDETDKILIDTHEITLFMLNLDEQYRSGGKRYSQYLLQEGNKMLLIGKANEENGKPIMTNEEIYNVFVIAPSDSVSSWNRFKPLRHKLIIWSCFIAFIFALLLLVHIEVRDKMVFIKFGKDMFGWGT